MTINMRRSQRIKGIIALSILLCVALLGYLVKGLIQNRHQQKSEKMNLLTNLSLPKPQAFSLDNGLQVVLVPDRRFPSAVFMVWYRVGAADEKTGKTGLAHFLEHLMFKGTDAIKVGQFSREVAREGGALNAFTYYDYTAYFEEISPDRLERMMQMESDRMLNLRLDDENVRLERDVVLEERRKSIDNDPAALLYFDMTAKLFQNSSYQESVIGTFDDISHLEREDALAFYKTYYAPNNAVIVVAGDVEEDTLKQLVQKYYGTMTPSATLKETRPARVAPKPLQRSETIRREDERVHNTQVWCMRLAPSTQQVGTHKSMSIHMMAFILGGGETGRLYRDLVMDKKLVSDVSLHYDDSLKDAGSLTFSATLLPGVKVEDVLGAFDTVSRTFLRDGPTEAEIKRAQVNIAAHFIYASDNQRKMAEFYGSSLLTGLGLDEIESLPFVAMNVSKNEVMEQAQAWLLGPSVTGILSPKGGA